MVADPPPAPEPAPGARQSRRLRLGFRLATLDALGIVAVLVLLVVGAAWALAALTARFAR